MTYFYIFQNRTCIARCDFRPATQDGQLVIASDTFYNNPVLNEDNTVGEAVIPLPVVDIEQLRADLYRLIDQHTSLSIRSGFQSTATGTTYYYDSEVTDQHNLNIMLAAANSPDFATDPIYQGQIPIRARASPTEDKVVLMHDQPKMQKLIDDMAKWIGYCKRQQWMYQQELAGLTTVEELTEFETRIKGLIVGINEMRGAMA